MNPRRQSREFHVIDGRRPLGGAAASGREAGLDLGYPKRDGLDGRAWSGRCRRAQGRPIRPEFHAGVVQDHRAKSLLRELHSTGAPICRSVGNECPDRGGYASGGKPRRDFRSDPLGLRCGQLPHHADAVQAVIEGDGVLLRGRKPRKVHLRL